MRAFPAARFLHSSNMPVVFSVLFAAIIIVALFKLFFDDLEDLLANIKSFCWWFSFELILNLPPETNQTGLRFFFWLAAGAIGGSLLYYRLVH
jgi:hypothetical protein